MEESSLLFKTLGTSPAGRAAVPAIQCQIPPSRSEKICTAFRCIKFHWKCKHWNRNLYQGHRRAHFENPRRAHMSQVAEQKNRKGHDMRVLHSKGSAQFSPSSKNERELIVTAASSIRSSFFSSILVNPYKARPSAAELVRHAEQICEEEESLWQRWECNTWSVPENPVENYSNSLYFGTHWF